MFYVNWLKLSMNPSMYISTIYMKTTTHAVIKNNSDDIKNLERTESSRWIKIDMTENQITDRL